MTVLEWQGRIRLSAEPRTGCILIAQGDRTVRLLLQPDQPLELRTSRGDIEADAAVWEGAQHADRPSALTVRLLPDGLDGRLLAYSHTVLWSCRLRLPVHKATALFPAPPVTQRSIGAV